MKTYAIMHPMLIPTTKPTYTPTAPQPKTNANNPANITSRMNALRIVKKSEIVPFPMDWKMLPANIPRGMNNMKKHRILNASTTLADNTALLEEYENMNDNGSANKKKIEQMIIEEINPNLAP